MPLGKIENTGCLGGWGCSLAVQILGAMKTLENLVAVVWKHQSYHLAFGYQKMIILQYIIVCYRHPLKKSELDISTKILWKKNLSYTFIYHIPSICFVRFQSLVLWKPFFFFRSCSWKKFRWVNELLELTIRTHGVAVFFFRFKAGLVPWMHANIQNVSVCVFRFIWISTYIYTKVCIPNTTCVILCML